MNDIETIWNQSLESIRNLLQDDTAYTTFYEPSKLYRLENGVATILVETHFANVVLKARLDIIEEALKLSTNQIYKIEIVTADQLDTVKNVKPVVSKPEVSIKDNLLSNFVFDQFVVGDSNKIAQAASLATAINPGLSFNPLFIYGNSGLGKTHLLNAIGNYIKDHRPEMTVMYVQCMDFVNEYVNSIKNGKIDDFNEKYRSLDILLVDDIQFLSGKEKSHEVFFHIFNHMISNKKQIVLTADRMPQDLAGLENRLVSRFSSGLSVSVDPPEYETALAILKKKMEMQNVDIENFDEEVLIFMAKKYSKDVRVLEGQLNRLIYFSIFENASRITMNLALEAFKDDSKYTIPSTGKLTAEKIKKTVAEYYNLSLTQLVSKTRVSNISMARHISMYLIRDLLNMSYIKIGEEFGGRDHSTVMTACDKVSRMMEKDAKYREALEEIRAMLK